MKKTLRAHHLSPLFSPFHQPVLSLSHLTVPSWRQSKCVGVEGGI
jgi:hypothetical protein